MCQGSWGPFRGVTIHRKTYDYSCDPRDPPESYPNLESRKVG